MSTPTLTTRPPLLPSTSSTATAPTITTTRPPVDLHPAAHLDTAAYVQGVHAISLGASTLVHPRARLISAHGPLIIASGTVIHSRCVVGGPAPDPNTDANTNADADADAEADPVKTTIGTSVLLHASSSVHAGARVGDFSIVEPAVVIARGVKIGAHAKVCAGCVVERDVADWEIVWGGGMRRRKRVQSQEYEDVRLKALGRDREVSVGLLRAAQQRAAQAVGARRKG